MEKCRNLAAAAKPKYQRCDKIVDRRRKGMQPINGTRRGRLERCLRFGDFQCYRRCFAVTRTAMYFILRAAAQVPGHLLRDGSAEEDFRGGKKIYGDIPPSKGIGYRSKLLSHTITWNDFGATRFCS